MPDGTVAVAGAGLKAVVTGDARKRAVASSNGRVLGRRWSPLAAVTFGLFSSMNQALVGAMAGAGGARGRDTVHTTTLRGILRGWVIGPGTGLAAAYALTRTAVLVAGPHTLVAT